ncbi:MAG TPA: LysM peptidoglycan-binding domain-containing M23 family metallopeptidase [Acidimicrobiia bacterium]|jgi:LysM repeat protein|nr:LysM peptidoglycan-binding domain-containing M23 family metallopeptidase [Acidimicrobiia bacterium]
MSVLAFVSMAVALTLPLAPSVDDDHTVVPGDTVSAIAKEYGVSTRELVAANDLANPNLIVVGEILRIPGQDVIHKVQTGETLSQIARKYGTTVAELAAANGIVNVNLIVTGSQLTVTGSAASSGSTPTAAPPPPPDFGQSPATYVIVGGDTLSVIAARFDTTVDQLLKLNGMSDPNRITAGASLTVPGQGFICPVPNAIYINDWHFPRPGGRLHVGTDMFAPAGTPILAPVSGELEQIDGSLGGLQFWLHGDDGHRYIGSHMASFGLEGRVQAGDIIGRVGNTGNARTTPPHLHFEIAVDGVEINPYLVLKDHGC